MNEPSNASLKATKDCRVCNRRRIKCDRSTPTCKKCSSRNLTCPGYGVKLNWEWGVASRGKLARKSIPLLGPSPGHIDAPSPRVDEDSSELYFTQERTGEEDHDLAENPRDVLVLHTQNKTQYEGTVGAVIKTHQHLYPYAGITPFSPLTPALLQNATSWRLLHHYEETIASTMVWVDSDSNPWRSVMIPMALQSNSLLMSILALAAEHLSAISSGNDDTVYSFANQSMAYRDKALRLLALDMQSDHMIGGVSAPEITLAHRNDLANALLASMLMLCNMEQVRPESKLWRVHLDAARTIVKLRSSVPSPEDTTFNYLVQQFFITDAFACTTSFVRIDQEELMTEDDGSVFIELLRLVRRVTAIERQTEAHGWPNLEDKIPASTLRDLFEQARNRTRVLSANTTFATPAERAQFTSVIESFHHAGLLYSYRCLSYPDQEEEISRIRLLLFQDLDLLPSDHSGFAQDVMWPLFIAGTEANSEDGTRVLVERKLDQAMRRTGFSNCQEALAFLRALWAARDGGESPLAVPPYQHEQRGATNELNWIHCARAWANMGNHFLVF